MAKGLRDCINVASTSQFKAALKRAAYYERTTLSMLCRKWLTAALEVWQRTAPERIEFNIFLSPSELGMLLERGFLISDLIVEGYTDSEDEAPTPGFPS